MANEYLYGTYGNIGETVVKSAIKALTVAVYIGLLPVNLVRGYASAGIVNNPVKVSNFGDAQKKMGYSSDWNIFTLCEAFAAHFDNEDDNIGPIYVINVLDPATMKAEAATTKNLTFVGGRAEFKSDKIILDTLLLAEKTEGTDFAVDYNFAKGSVVITSIGTPITGVVEATYFEVTPVSVTSEEIIGGIGADGVYTGLGAIALLYQEYNVVPNLIAAPGFSNIPAVYLAMVAASKKINGHWDGFVAADIPILDGATAVDTIAKAKAWKVTNAYNSERSKTFWPKVVNKAGQIFHLSTLAVAVMLKTDLSHNSIPMETPGNKKISVVKLYFGSTSTNRGYDQQTANELTKHGISTAVFWGGKWVLWGDHTAAYAFDTVVDARTIFDVSMRMLMHITNSFQLEWGESIDKPMPRQLKDSIINREQEKLDSLVSLGALIGSPRVLFLGTENTETSMMNGDFKWDIPVTPTPPFKSATVSVAYTDAGFSVYFEGSEA